MSLSSNAGLRMPKGYTVWSSDGTEILVSVLEPDDAAVAETAADLAAGGYSNLTLVSPSGYEPPVSPMPDRSAA